jgi:hypothetical protein
MPRERMVRIVRNDDPGALEGWEPLAHVQKRRALSVESAWSLMAVISASRRAATATSDHSTQSTLLPTARGFPDSDRIGAGGNFATTLLD